MTKSFKRQAGNLLYTASKEIKQAKDSEKVAMAAVVTCIAAMARLQDLTHKINYEPDYQLSDEERAEAEFLIDWYKNLGKENAGKLRDMIRDIVVDRDTVINATIIALMGGGTRADTTGSQIIDEAVEKGLIVLPGMS